MKIELKDELKVKLKNAVEKNQADGILLSGGLDTSILVAISSNMTAINVSLEDFSSDLKYARILEKIFDIEVYYVKIGIDEALSSIKHVIKILETFDPALPNDLAVYFGIRCAKEVGLRSVMTGDGSDELFGGYSYMRDIEDLNAYIERILPNIYFSSNRICEHFGIKVVQPYLCKEVVDFSLKIPAEFKIRNGVGKWILRKAFEDLLPAEIVWQDKRPLEYGSGMTRLREIISSKISDKEFMEKRNLYPIKFMSKEHLYYYEIYRDVIGEIPEPKEDDKACPYCGAGINTSSLHCRICGGVLNWRK